MTLLVLNNLDLNAKQKLHLLTHACKSTHVYWALLSEYSAKDKMTRVRQLPGKGDMTVIIIMCLISEDTHLVSKFIRYAHIVYIQSNFNGSNIFGTIENCSRHG